MKKATRIFASCVLRGVALVLILQGAAVLRGADADVSYPPEPQMPEMHKEMTPDQRREVVQKWMAEHDKWEHILTPEQHIAWKKAEEDKEKKEQERFRKMGELPTPVDGYDWKKIADGRKLNKAIVASLEKYKAAYGRSVEQSFSPYLGGPVFITSDSLLNAFHVLFEDSFCKLELCEAYQFAGTLKMLLENARALQADRGLNFPRERYQAALRHAQLVLGPAIVLLGGSPESLDAGVRDEVMTQVGKIMRAEAMELPPWLSPADENSLLALDYRLFKPVGFYTSNEKLAAYFRAVRWLQMVPFRGSRPVEMDAAMLLGLSGGGKEGTPCGPGQDFRRIARLVGPPDDPSPFDLAGFLDNQTAREFRLYDCALPEVRAEIVRRLTGGDYYKINSDLRLSSSSKDSFAKIIVRLMPAARLQDAVLFQRLMDSHITPSGLTFAALLQSPFAVDKLAANERKIVENARKEMPPEDALRADRNKGLEIYERYVRTLKTLFAQPAPEAPDFMRNDFWAAKNCQTALAGWAQMRHTFTLQAKENKVYLGIAILPPGFVEPNPEFFASMSRLLETVTAYLEADNFFMPSGASIADDIRGTVSKLKKIQAHLDASETLDDYMAKLSDDEQEDFFETVEMGRHDDPNARVAMHSFDSKESQAGLKSYINMLNSLASAYERGEKQPDYDSSRFRERWNSLKSTTRVLINLANKQLHKEPWTNDDEKFLKSYGESLGFIMGYFGNSYDVPRDDAPRWVEVARDPRPGRDMALAVAVGRPRYLYVLYPWNGMEILCQGSVMQYYEYEARANAAPLTDVEWMKLLDSPDAPPIPEWLRPFADAPGKPAAR